MLVAKQVTVTTTPVELLAGEDVSQGYALHFGSGRGSGLRIGDSAMASAADGFDPAGLDEPLRLQGVSLWAAAFSGSVTVDILAYSTPGE